MTSVKCLPPNQMSTNYISKHLLNIYTCTIAIYEVIYENQKFHPYILHIPLINPMNNIFILKQLGHSCYKKGKQITNVYFPMTKSHAQWVKVNVLCHNWSSLRGKRMSESIEAQIEKHLLRTPSRPGSGTSGPECDKFVLIIPIDV